MRAARLALVALAAGLAAACGSEPTAGELVGRLEAERTDAEAIRFVIRATPPNEVHGATPACNACQVFLSAVDPTELRGVVVGSLGPGPVLRVAVSDVNSESGYRVDVIEIADGAYELLPRGDFRIRLQK